MTDYHYQADYDEPPDEDGRNEERAAAAEQYPADRDFFLGQRRQPGRSGWSDEPRDEPVFDEAAYEADAASWEDAAELAYRPEEADDAPGPYEVGPPAAAAAAGRVSVAEAGRSAERRIRFDPTQERGAAHYDSARRHSRTVRGLKIILPAVALFGVLAFLAFVQFAPTPEEAVITLSGINVEEKSVTMEKPHISGFEETRRSYEVRAVEAVQDLNNPKMMTLKTITARLGMGNGETAHVTAVTGRYDGNASTLQLSDGITLRTTNGYRATLEDAQIDIKTSHMTSSKPVEIVTDRGTVKANAIEVQDNGKHIVFKHGVTVFYTPPEGGDEEASAAPAAGTALPATAPAGDLPGAESQASGGST